jgi:hypothetical protein
MKSSPKKKSLTSNVSKGIVTTVIGVVILTASVVSIFMANGITWTDASIGIGIGLALMFAPDTIISTVTELFKKS